MTRQSIMRYFVVVSVLSWTLSTFAAGKVEVTGDTSHGTVTSKADGAVVTLTVTPQEGYYIRKSDIKATRTFMPTASARGANRGAINGVPMPDDLTLVGNDPDDLSQPRTYTVTLPGEEYDILLDVKYSQKQTVTESMVSLSEMVFVYNEQVQRPVVSVQGLTENREYTVTYSNPTSSEAGTYTVTVTGYSTWAGTITRNYKIFRGGKAEVNNNLNGGTISTAVDGLTVTLTVTPSDGYYIRKEDVTLSKTFMPAAGAARSAVKGVPIADGLELIGEDPEDLSLPRTYTAQLPGWEYSVYADAAFSARQTVTDAMVQLSTTSFIYNGGDQKPVVTVTNLTENKDYLLTFQGTSWSDVGTYSLTVTGKSTWKGTVKKTFKINKAMSVVTKRPEAQKLTYNKTALTLISAGDATGGTMMYSIDGNVYQITLPTATDAGDYTVYYKVAGDSNHNDTQPETITASIGKAEILISGITAENKVYDGTKDATLQFGNVIFGGIVAGDKLTVTAEGEFADANAGTDKLVNISGLTLGGESLANYSLAAEGQQSQTAAIIMPRSIDGAQISNITPQTYTGEPIVPEVSVTLDDVALSANKDYTVAYTDNINVGTAVTTVTGQGNYTGSTQAMFTITRAAAGVVTAPESLTLTYNGTAQALLNGGTAEGGTMVYSLDGESFGESIPTATGAGEYTVYYKVSGDGNHNDTQPETITVSIGKAEITVSGITAEDKVYDGTKDVTLQFDNVIFGGIAVGDKLTVSADGEFADANAGTGKIVNISGLTLGGESLPNYSLAAEGQQNQTVATIMPRSIENAQVADITPMQYTGEPLSPEVSVTLDDVLLTIGTDYTTAYVDNINVGTAVTTITGQGNYTGSTQAMFSIVKAAAGVITAPEARTLTYDGTAQALLNDGKAEGGTMVYSLDGTLYEETIPSATNAGEYTFYYKVAGDSNHNDTQPETVTANIGKAEILISGITAENKVYDGTKDVTLQFGNVIFGGIVAGDKLTVTAEGEFADANAGTDKLVNISGLTLGGESLSNYILASEGQQNQTVATISKAAASIVISPVSRTLTYDGMAQTLLNAGTAEGGSMIYSLDGDSFEEAIPTGINAGEYTVYYKVDGDCNHNDTEPETITVNIGKVMLTVTAQDKRIFCNEEMPTLTVSYSGFVNNETERRLTVKPVVQTDATPESEAGVYDINVSGGEAVNYDFTYVKGTLTMLIPEFVDDKGKGVEAELVSDGQGKTNAVITELPNSFWEGKSEIPTTVTDIAGEEYEVKEVASEAFDDMSSDLIVVLPEGLSTTEPVTNVVNGDGTCETLDLTDVSNFSLPIDVEVDSVVYVREVKSETTTICLPYDIPAPENATVYTMKETEGEGIVFEEHTGDLQAFQPYVLKMESSSMARGMVRGTTESQPSVTLDLGASNVNISHTASEGSIQKDQFILCGTVRSLTHKEGLEKKAYIMQPDLSWRMTASSDPEDADEQYLAPFQAYLLYTGIGEIEEVPTSLEPSITGIETLKEEPVINDKVNGTDGWYDLTGRKLPGKPSKKGLYIYQNKKVKL